MKKKVLLVDDDEGLRDFYREELEDEGDEVLTAINGKEALREVENEKPDLIVLDIVMPVMDGMEALGRILRKDKRVSVILRSSHSVYQKDFMSRAADAYIVKSCDNKQLKEKIRELLDKNRRGARMS
jgi:two-component system response regulator (stage 0 sporulation protein F)